MLQKLSTGLQIVPKISFENPLQLYFDLVALPLGSCRSGKPYFILHCYSQIYNIHKSYND